MCFLYFSSDASKHVALLRHGIELHAPKLVSAMKSFDKHLDLYLIIFHIFILFHHHFFLIQLNA